MSDDLVAAVVRFAGALRAGGVPVTMSEARDALRALGLVDIGDRSEVYLALRSVLVSREAEYAIFDELFARAWEREGAQKGGTDGPTSVVPRRTAAPKQPPPARAPTVTLESWMRGAVPADETIHVPRASDREAAGAKDFRSFTADELEEITRVARRIARRLAARPSRRWTPAPRGSRVHPRRTMRQSLRTGGEVAELAFRERKRRKTKLVTLCDISGSMDLYSRFLLQFLFAVQHSFARVETFAFSTRLHRITDALTAGSFRDALDRLARERYGWSGGTRIGASLAAFADGWPRLVDRRTIVVILSDGWDTGDPEVLAGALERIHRRAGRVLWLNPLLGSAAYEPRTRGMQAALPHVDAFLPAHSLASLAALERHLRL